MGLYSTCEMLAKCKIIPDFAAGFGIRRKISAYFLLKKFLNLAIPRGLAARRFITIKYSQTFLCVNILSFFVSVLKPAAIRV